MNQDAQFVLPKKISPRTAVPATEAGEGGIGDGAKLEIAVVTTAYGARVVLDAAAEDVVVHVNNISCRGRVGAERAGGGLTIWTVPVSWSFRR
jgi:hypothetical protein